MVQKETYTTNIYTIEVTQPDIDDITTKTYMVTEQPDVMDGIMNEWCVVDADDNEEVTDEKIINMLKERIWEYERVTNDVG
jgi:hypothetical protein